MADSKISALTLVAAVGTDEIPIARAGTTRKVTATSLVALGGGTPGGSTTQIQFNDGGVFGGDSGLTYDKTDNRLTLADASSVGTTVADSTLKLAAAITGERESPAGTRLFQAWAGQPYASFESGITQPYLKIGLNVFAGLDQGPQSPTQGHGTIASLTGIVEHTHAYEAIGVMGMVHARHTADAQPINYAVGVDGEAFYTGTRELNHLVGGFFLAMNQEAAPAVSSSDVHETVGLKGNAYMDSGSGGETDNLCGVRAYAKAFRGIATNVKILWVASAANDEVPAVSSPTITNHYGVYIEDCRSIGSSINRALFSAGGDVEITNGALLLGTPLAASSGGTGAASLAAGLDAIGSTRGSILRRGASAWEALTPGTAGHPLVSGGAGADPSYGTPSSVLDIIGSTRGSVLYRGASGWAALTPGTSGHVLTSQGVGADPIYAAAGGGGTPGGSDTQVQFNDGGAFGGDSGMVFAKATNTLTMGGPILIPDGSWSAPAIARAADSAYGLYWQGNVLTLKSQTSTEFVIGGNTIWNTESTGLMAAINNNFDIGKSGLFWRDIYIAGVVRGAALVALGGGSTPTLGTIGGSGPATAAQNTWMKFIDSGGNSYWVPVWK